MPGPPWSVVHTTAPAPIAVRLWHCAAVVVELRPVPLPPRWELHACRPRGPKLHTTLGWWNPTKLGGASVDLARAPGTRHAQASLPEAVQNRLVLLQHSEPVPLAHALVTYSGKERARHPCISRSVNAWTLSAPQPTRPNKPPFFFFFLLVVREGPERDV